MGDEDKDENENASTYMYCTVNINHYLLKCLHYMVLVV